VERWRDGERERKQTDGALSEEEKRKTIARFLFFLFDPDLSRQRPLCRPRHPTPKRAARSPVVTATLSLLFLPLSLSLLKKMKMAEMPSLPPAFAPSPSAPTELSLARDALETALVLDAALGDDAAFDRDAAQLAPYYADARGLLPDSADGEPLCASLMLLRSLVAGRLAAFHADAARLPAAVARSPAVATAVALEAWLAEGAYNKVLEEGSRAGSGGSGSSGSSPDLATAATAHFLGQLLATVRSEVATCCEAAYASLAVDDAARLLRLASGDAELAAIAERRGWKVRGGRVFFPRDDGEGEGGEEEAAASSSSSCAASVAAPGPELIVQALTYARELERIV